MAVQSIEETAAKANRALPIWLLFALYGHSTTYHNWHIVREIPLVGTNSISSQLFIGHSCLTISTLLIVMFPLAYGGPAASSLLTITVKETW